jgi:hypothetical protein
LNFQKELLQIFYNPKNWKTLQDGLRWIDEPTNTVTLTFENEKNIFFLRAYHPKYIKENRQYSNDPDRPYRITGKINTLEVDEYMKLDPSYEDFQLGRDNQINLLGIQNSHFQMEFSLGYGKKIELMNLKKFGQLVMIPDFAFGVMVGNSRTTFRDTKDYWQYSTYEDGLKAHGVSLALSNKIEWSFPKFRIFGDVRYHYAKLKHSIDANGGYAKYNLPVLATTIGIGINIWSGKKDKK